jgi:hypothetical protein
MGLTLGVICLCGSVLAFFLLLLSCRNPRPSRWSNDFLVANVFSPLLIGVAVFGVAELVRVAFRAEVADWEPARLLPAAATVVLTAVALKALRVRRTLASFALESAPGKVIDLAAARPGTEQEEPKPPVQPKGRKRAA